MLKIIKNTNQLSYGQLMQVYYETNLKNSQRYASSVNDVSGILEAEQEHYLFLQEFFRERDAFLAVWAPDGTYKAALRIEPYQDGFLLEGLETAPDCRRQGYAKNLILHTLDYLSERGVRKLYSHIDMSNIPSVKVHESCGFLKLYDHALFVDGSVDHHTFTYLKSL